MLATVAPGVPQWLGIFQDLTYVSITLVIILVISIAFGAWITRSARMEDAWWRYSLVLGSLLLGLLCIANKWPPKLGVDLKGGANIIGEIDPEALKDSGVTNVDAAIDRFLQRLKQRIDPSGIREIVIRRRGRTQIEVIIPDVDEKEAGRLWKRMTTIGHMQFRMLAVDAAERGEVAKDLALTQAELEDELARRRKEVTSTKIDPDTDKPTIVARWYDLGRVDDDSKAVETGKPNPYRFFPGATGGMVGALLRDGSTGRIVPLDRFSSVNFGDNDIRLRNVTRLAESMGITDLQILLTEPREKSRVDGEHIKTVTPGRKGFEPIVEFKTDTQGTQRLARLTSAHKPKNNRKNFMAIVLDGKVMTAPSIDSAITQGQGYIEGGFTEKSVNDLVIILNSGKTNLALKNEYNSMETIQSSLGEEMKQRGVYAIVFSLLVVLVFMVVYYYQFAGIIACFALVMNMILVAASLFLLGQPITLTGLAGFVLTVGMSVDANVLIFERIREEIDKGTALRLAIRNGFDRATTTIIDANLTTLLTALVLYIIGHEQIKSFAIVLILGILTSMFTAIFVSRSIFDLLERKRMIKSLKMMKIFAAQKLPVTSISKVALSCSALLIVIGMAAAFVRGAGIFDYDLRGGSTASVVFTEPMKRSEISKKLNDMDLQIAKEKISFIVSPLQSAQYTDGTYYKIESSLRAADDFKDADGNVPADYKSLKEILKDQFGDKLIRLTVDAGEITFTDRNGKPVTPVKANGTEKKEEKKVSFTTPSFKPVYTSLSVVDQEKEEKKADEKKASDEKKTENASQDTSKQNTEKKEEVKKEAVKSDDQTKKAAEEKTEKPAETANPQQGSGSVGSNPSGQENPNNQPAKPVSTLALANFDLDFSVELLDQTIVGQILQAAQTLGINMEEDRIKVKTDNGTNRSKKFSVSITLSNKSDAQRIVDEMKSTLSSEPFFPRTSAVGGQIAGAGQQKAILALLISLIGIILYIWFRFQHIWFGFAAVAALVHDVMFVIGAIAVSYWLSSALGILQIDNFKISLQVVAALLTVVGYSLNDTIVVFDRIREVRGRSNKFTGDMIDISIGQTLSRTILTSFTTFMVVFILFGWGGDSIHAFAFALTVGVIIGTFSSVFVASPVLLWLMKVKPIAIDPIEPAEEVA